MFVQSFSLAEALLGRAICQLAGVDPAAGSFLLRETGAGQKAKLFRGSTKEKTTEPLRSQLIDVAGDFFKLNDFRVELVHRPHMAGEQFKYFLVKVKAHFDFERAAQDHEIIVQDLGQMIHLAAATGYRSIELVLKRGDPTAEVTT